MTSPLPGQSSVRVIDLFAGPGGWDLGASYLGIAPLGIEWDESACKTREAAGHRTLQADVSQLDPSAFGPCEGLIASPPCQSFSMAGKRGGEQDTEHVIACAYELVAGNDTRAEHRAKCEDARSMLVVEALRWVRDLRPRWVALEQVPPVLGLWTLFAGLMEAWGYRTWGGVLSAERYGVPQTRKRAILLASLDFQPHPPEPTHQAYVPGEPQRHEVTMFGEVLPWVSMAEALGWAEGERAYRLARGEGMLERHGQRPDTPDEAPAPAVTSKARSASWQVRTNNFTAKVRDPDGKRSKAGSEPYERDVDDPAPTLDGSADGWKLRAGTNDHGERLNDVSWVMRANAQGNAAVRSEEEPAPTITGGHDTGDRVWTTDRPATTLAGDPRVFSPGGHIAHDGRDNSKMVDRSEDAIRVSVQEASILQSFPPDYPWQGSRSAQFQQIGNAVPPKLAEAVLRQVAQVRESQEAAA